MLKFYPRCQNLEEKLIKIPSIPFSRHIFSLQDNAVIVTVKGSLPIPLASHIDRRGYTHGFTSWNDNSSKNPYDWLKPNWRFARPTRVVLLAEVEANFESMAWRG